MTTTITIDYHNSSANFLWQGGHYTLTCDDSKLRQRILEIMNSSLTDVQHDHDDTGNRRYQEVAISNDSPRFPRAFAHALREQGYTVKIIQNSK